MLNPVLSIIVYLTEMLISYIFFSNVSEKRWSAEKCVGIGCLFFGFGSALNLLFGNNSGINALVTISINCVFAFICFDIRFVLSLFYSFILLAISGAWEFIVISSVSALMDRGFFDYNSSFGLFILECPTCKILYFFTILILSRMVKSGERTNSLPLKLLFHPIATAMCLVIFWYVCAQPEVTYEIQYILAIASMILLSSTVLLFITYQHQIEADRESIQLRNEFVRLQSEKKYYDILEQQNEQLMIYAHDAKKHLAAINSLNTDLRISRYVSKLSEELAAYTRYCHSGNKLLDVMIHKFSVDCQMRGIGFDYDVKLCNLCEIEDTDLVAILGNLVDNAITAAEKTTERKVSIATTHRNFYSVIVITNSCDSPPKVRGNRLITTKAGPQLHGLGLKSVSRTLRKYQGDFEWEYDNDNHIFTVTIMVRKPANV